jgi:pimeloyl-ACP methyl ester carboxylesterase
MFAAIHPTHIRKLIMVSSGVFEELYTLEIMATRLGRLDDEEKNEVRAVSQALDDPQVADKNTPFARMGALIFKADSFDPITSDLEVIENQYDMIKSIWPEVEELRASGDLVNLGQAIKCPVVAIHGDYDPHPPDGVQRPLSRVLKDFRFIMLKDCGHYPWLERKARDGFYEILKNELNAR